MFPQALFYIIAYKQNACSAAVWRHHIATRAPMFNLDFDIRKGRGRGTVIAIQESNHQSTWLWEEHFYRKAINSWLLAIYRPSLFLSHFSDIFFKDHSTALSRDPSKSTGVEGLRSPNVSSAGSSWLCNMFSKWYHTASICVLKSRCRGYISNCGLGCSLPARRHQNLTCPPPCWATTALKVESIRKKLLISCKPTNTTRTTQLLFCSIIWQAWVNHHKSVGTGEYSG